MAAYIWDLLLFILSMSLVIRKMRLSGKHLLSLPAIHILQSTTSLFFPSINFVLSWQTCFSRLLQWYVWVRNRTTNYWYYRLPDENNLQFALLITVSLFSKLEIKSKSKPAFLAFLINQVLGILIQPPCCPPGHVVILSVQWWLLCIWVIRKVSMEYSNRRITVSHS